MSKMGYAGLNDAEGNSPEQQPGLALGWTFLIPDSIHVEDEVLVYGERAMPTASEIASAGPAKQGHFFFRGDDQRPRIVPVASEGMLFDFLDIARDGSASTILHYAQRWGPLRIGPCGRPIFHHCVCGRTSDEWGDTSPKGICGFTETQQVKMSDGSAITVKSITEPLAFWRAYAHLARAILVVAIALKDDKVGTPDDVSTLTLWGADADDSATEILAAFHDNRIEEGLLGLDVGAGWTIDDLKKYGQIRLKQLRDDYGKNRRIDDGKRQEAASQEQSRNSVENAMRRWLAELGVTLQFEWKSQATRETSKFYGDIQLACTSVLGAIGILLVQAISGATVPALCSGCGRFFMPTRKRVADLRAFCPDCRKEKNRVHGREYYQRKKARESGKGGG